MNILHFVSLMLLWHNGNGQGMGMFDFFGFGGGMADPFMGGGGGMGGMGGMGGGGGFADPYAPVGPDPALQDARLTMAEEQMAEVMGESPRNSPERQRIDRLIKQTGGQFTGDAAPLNYLVQEYMMTTPGPVPPPQPRPAKKARRAKQRQGKMKNRNRQNIRQNGGNAPNMNTPVRRRPQGGVGMQPPTPTPTRPTGRMGKQAAYQPQRTQSVTNQAMNQGQRNQLPPASSNMYQSQAPTNNPSYQGQPPTYNQGNQGRPQTNMYQAQTPPQNNLQGQRPNNQAPPIYQGQPQMNTNQRNNNAAQGQQRNNQQPGVTKSRSGVAADRLKRIEGRINSVNNQLNQARQMNNMAQMNDLQAQLEALNGVKQILTGGSAKTSRLETIRGSAKAPVALPKKTLQQKSAQFSSQQGGRSSNSKTFNNRPAQAPYGPPQMKTNNNNNVNNGQNTQNQLPYGPPQINRNNKRNGPTQVPFSPPRQRNNGINTGQVQAPYGPPSINRGNRNSFNNVPSNNNNFQETNVGGGKFAQTWTNTAPAPPAPATTRQTFQDPYPTANANAIGNRGFNPNRRNQHVEVNIQPYQNTGPSNDPYATNSQGSNQAAASYDPYPPSPAQQAAPYDPYHPSPAQQAAPYDPYPTDPAQQAAPYDPYPTDPAQQAAPYDPYPTDPVPYNQQPYDPQVLPYDPHIPTYQDPGMGHQGTFANNAPQPRRRQQQQRRGQGQRQGGARRGGRRRGGRRGGARGPQTTPPPTGTTVAPKLGDTKFIRGEEYIYTDADGFDTFQWIKKSLIPASQLDHLPQAGQEQQGGQGAAGGEAAPQPA